MFTVNEAILVRRDGTEYGCYFILEDGLPVYEVNKWLEYKGVNSLMTSRKYAFELCKFLNYLKQNRIFYRDVKKKDVLNFLHYLLFGKEINGIIPIQSTISYQTATSYLTVIKEFFKYLEDMSNEEINITYSSAKRINKHTYLYGQIWDMEVKEILAAKLPRIKETKQHLKWYSLEEIDAISTQFNTVRDKAIFLLTLEGMRISEVINLNLDDYISDEKLVNIQKAKGNKQRIVPLRIHTVQAIESYLYAERSLVEEEMGLFEALFVNIRTGKKYGQRVAYRNILNIIKNAANRAGLDANQIRTHSGRSTRTMELLRYQAEHPEENFTDQHIRLLMGWNSSKSLEPYINQKDERLLVSLAGKINEKGKR